MDEIELMDYKVLTRFREECAKEIIYLRATGRYSLRQKIKMWLKMLDFSKEEKYSFRLILKEVDWEIYWQTQKLKP